MSPQIPEKEGSPQKKDDMATAAEDNPSSYFLSTNPAETERLMGQHKILIDALNGRLVLPPINLSQPGLKILDSGTADGHWIRALRASFPNPTIHTYIGTDINTSLFPPAHSLPPDTTFFTQNIAHEWPTHLHSTFDLIHQRLTLPGAAPTSSLPTALSHLWALLKPGGWMQLVEAEQVGRDTGPVFGEFLTLVRALFCASGAGCDYAREMRGWLEGLGALEVGEEVVDLGFGKVDGDGDGEMAEMSARCTAGAMDGLVRHAKLMPGLVTGMSVEQMDTLGERLLVELRERGAYYRIRCVWGRKKEETEAVV